VTSRPAPPRAFARALAAATAVFVLAAPAAADTPERGDFGTQHAIDAEAARAGEVARSRNEGVAQGREGAIAS